MNKQKMSHLLSYLLIIIQSNIMCVAYIDVPNIQRRTLSAVLAREGDLNIGHLTDITIYSDVTKTCGPARTIRGCEAVEMAIYIVDKINRRTDLLPNITLGFVIVDGCSVDKKALEAVSYFVKDNSTCSDSGRELLSNVSFSNQDQTFSEELKSYRVIGIVGPQTSTIAKAVSVFMGVFEISMIGIRATSDELSDKSRYEYFLRLVAPDSRLVLPLLGIVQHYGWKYVSVVYSAGAYGENAYKQVSDLLLGKFASYGICVAVALKLSTSPGEDEIETVTDELIRNENAKVVIGFLEQIKTAKSLFGAMLKKRELGTFIWLGADSTASYEHEPSMEDMLEGMMFVDHAAVTMPDFESHIETITPLNSRGDPWILNIWEDEYNCTFDSNSVHVQDSKCSEKLNLDSNICPLVPTQYNRVHDAYLVFAQAAHNHIMAECPGGFSNKELLKTCNWGEAFLQRIKKSTFQGILGRIVFNENGDFSEDLILKQYYKPTDSSPPTTKIVGLWNSTEERLYMNESEVSWKVFNRNLTLEDVSKPPISVCSHPCLKKQYAMNQSVSCCWTCMDCRNNEIIADNGTYCLACPMFTWPDDQTARLCQPIAPIFLEISHLVSVTLLCISAILMLLSIIYVGVLLANRKNRMLEKLNVKLNNLIMLGILIACMTVVVLMVPPDTSRWICTMRNAGFHIGINLIYSPLLVKNVLICRFYIHRKRNFQGPPVISSESQIVFFNIMFLCQLTLVIASEIVSTSEATLLMPRMFEKYVELYCFKPTAWFLLPLCYNIIIMLLCAGIGFITRKLSDNFNESWFIFLSVATALFAWIVFIPVYFTVSNMYLQPAILGFALILNALVTLICQYLPIIYALVFVVDNTAEAALATPDVVASNAVAPMVEG